MVDSFTNLQRQEVRHLMDKSVSCPARPASCPTTTFRNIPQAFLDQSQNYYDLVMNAPAFAIAEENLSSFNELRIIENWFLRTQL